MVDQLRQRPMHGRRGKELDEWTKVVPSLDAGLAARGEAGNPRLKRDAVSHLFFFRSEMGPVSRRPVDSGSAHHRSIHPIASPTDAP